VGHNYHADNCVLLVSLPDSVKAITVIPLSHLCGSSRGSTTAEKCRKPEIYGEDRVGTVLAAIKT